jgi:FkbM family methyltransferase
MSIYSPVRRAATSLGVYRVGRWSYRHFLNRAELQVLEAERAIYGQFAGSGDVVFDIGANVGAKSEVFLQLGARVIAFEPQPAVHPELRASCGYNRRFTLVAAALGPAAGTATLHITPRNSGEASLVADWVPGQTAEVKVPVRTMDDAMKEFGRPAFCKIDVEGFELEVFKGMTSPVPALSFEYHLSQKGIPKVLACLDYLSGFGPLRINYVADGKTGFGLQRWADKESFVSYFANELQKEEGCFFGGVFVQLEAPGTPTRAG